MANHRQRIDALRALIAGSVLGANPIAPIVDAEFLDCISAGRVRILRRRYLLQVLHSTRALDSALRAFLDHHGILQNQNTLNQYLVALRDNGTGVPMPLPEAQRLYFRQRIVDQRNIFMHRAGAAPLADQDVADLLGEMDACLAVVFSL
jgi:hypothetical protein